MSSIVVTGSSGFLGSAVMAELAERGHTAISFDRRHGQDVCDRASVDQGLQSADGVIHLAGVLGTGELFDHPEEAVEVNIMGALNVIRSATEHNVHMVGIEMPRVWPNVYQATKTCARTLMTAWHRNEGLRCSSVRAFNVYGPGQKVHGVQKIIPTFATRAWRGELIPIWGDGTQTVDLVWVGDVARMLVDALDFGNDETFDGGTGMPWRVVDVAFSVWTQVAREQPTNTMTHLPMRKGEHPTKVVATGEGWDNLGWHPEFRDDEFRDTVRWYKEDRP